MLLDGMRVLSFCHFLQGPAAMQYLADMGAEIIKIEPPRGAYERHWAGADRAKVGGVSAFYLSANRGARSLAIDLKHAEAREVVFRLLDGCQVLAENFRPGTLDRLGFGYADVRKRKADVIYASASGFGGSGPYASRPGQDLLIQAMSGLVAATGGSGRGPTAVGCAVADQHGGALLALGILGAYVKWLKSGEGTHVEANLLSAGIDLQGESLVTYYASRRGRPAFTRDPHLATWFHEAPYGIYRLRDATVALSMNLPEKLAQALDSERIRAFVGRNAYEERDGLAQLVQEELADLDFATASAALEREGLWYARVEDYDDLLENPQVQHNGTFEEMAVNGETVRLVGHPLRYDGKRPDLQGFALAPGVHSRELLAEGGFSEDEVEELLRNRVVFAA